VRTRAPRVEGHTRIPAYLTERRGRIEAIRGYYPLADERATGAANIAAQPLYSVAFDGEEIWGDRAAAHLTIVADLWEAYLEASEP
jgi:hypothetical protein